MAGRTLSLVALSDTHGLHATMDHEVPDGDVLIHAGDFCGRGLMPEVSEFAAWMGEFPHEGYGATISDEIPETQFFNASVCTAGYRPENAPFVISVEAPPAG